MNTATVQEKVQVFQRCKESSHCLKHFNCTVWMTNNCREAFSPQKVLLPTKCYHNFYNVFGSDVYEDWQVRAVFLHFELIKYVLIYMFISITSGILCDDKCLSKLVNGIVLCSVSYFIQAHFIYDDLLERQMLRQTCSVSMYSI